MELRHLRYFTAVVQWKSYREASRRIHVAQPAISQTVTDLENELGLKLLSRAKRVTRLTSEGEVFYAEAVRTLAQAELAVETARRAARGDIGRLSIGFIGSATSAFLPELVRKFKGTYPGVKLTLHDLRPVQQDAAFEKGEIDIGFTRTLTAEQSRTIASRVLFREPMLAMLPRSRRVKGKRVRIADLASESFVLFHREGHPALFDTVLTMCQKAGFSPRVENQPSNSEALLSLVEAEHGVSIVPACARHLYSNGVKFYRLQPDDVRVELVAAWKAANPSVVLRAFLELIDTNAAQIRKKAELR